MADQERSSESPQARFVDLANKIEFHEEEWGDVYVGSLDALVAMGLARQDQFPGQPGRAKTVARYQGDREIPKGTRRWIEDETYLQIFRDGVRRFRLFVGIDDAERDRREAEARRMEERERLEQRDELHTSTRRYLLELQVKSGVDTHERFRDQKRESLDDWARILNRVVFENSYGPFRYDIDAEDREQLNQAFATLRWIVDHCQVIRDSKAAAEFEQCKRSMQAKDDTAFQSFISGTLAGNNRRRS